MVRKLKFGSILFGMLMAGVWAGLPMDARGAYYVIDDEDGERISWYSSTNLNSNSIIIGLDNPDNSLEIENGATVKFNSIYLGADESASNNTFEVDDMSYVKASGYVVIGDESVGNYMQIHSGADLYSSYGYIGYEDEGIDNLVEVDGVGSIWDVSNDLHVGYEGSSNSLQVTDGGEVEAKNLIVGWDSEAVGNTVTVDDAILDVKNDVVVGYTGSDNTLIVSGGSEVNSDYIYVGRGYTNSESYWVTGNDNSILITGEDTLWTNYYSVYVGTNDATGNSITVEDGAELVVFGEVVISNDNDFVLGENGTLIVHSNFNAGADGFTFGDAATLAVGGELTGLTSGEIENGRGITVFSENGEWDMSGMDVTVGASSSFNTLQVMTGAWVSVQNLSVGTGDNANSNTVYAAGEDTLLEIGGSLALGSSNSMDNVITVYSGAVVQVEGTFAMSGDNVFNVSSGGWFKVGGDLDVSAAGFNFDEYGAIQVGGELTGMTNVLDGNRSLYLAGSGASWNVGLDPLQVSSSTLMVSNGASLFSAGAVLGADGLAAVTGAGSSWTNSASLHVNDGGVLLLQQGGLLDVGGTLTLSGSELRVDSGGSAAAGGYYQDSDSVFSFDTVTTDALTLDDALVTVSGSAEFESGATIEYTGAISDVAVDVTNQQLLVSASDLIVAGETNAVDSGLSNLNAVAVNSLFSLELYSESSALYAQLIRTSLAESAGFKAGSQMYKISTAIDDMATASNKTATTQLNLLSAMSGSEQNAQMSQLYDRGAPTYMHMEGLYEAMGQVQNRGIVPDTYWAIGPEGPHLYGSQVQLWMKGFGSWGMQDDDGAFSGYDQSVYGMVIGMDKAFGDLLVGLAGGYSTSSIEQDDGDTSDAGMGYGILYGSWGTSSWFADGNLALGFGSVENESGTDFDVSADFDASEFGFYFGGGKEMLFKEDMLFITPTAAILGGKWSQDGYTDESSNSVKKRVDDYSRWSFKSDIGVEAVFRMEGRSAVLMPEVHANWIHEFNSDEESIGYSLVGSGGSYDYTMAAPVSDLFELGTAVSLWTQNRKGRIYEIALGYDARFGSGYLANILNARVNIEF